MNQSPSRELTADLLAYDALNLGCGQYPIEGALNVDALPQSKADFLADLNNFSELGRLPKDHYQRIYMFHVLEHLEDPFGIMRTCASLLRSGGTIQIRVPHASRGFTHAEHKHGFDVSFPYYFNQNYATFFYGTNLELVSMKLDWAVRFDIYKLVIPGWQVAVLRFMNVIITPLANLSPGLCSRLWCYWVGGFEQIEYVFRKP